MSGAEASFDTSVAVGDLYGYAWTHEQSRAADLHAGELRLIR
jgi:hypothetical protein